MLDLTQFSPKIDAFNFGVNDDLFQSAHHGLFSKVVKPRCQTVFGNV